MRSLELVAGWPVRAAGAGVLAGGNHAVAATSGDADRSYDWAPATKLVLGDLLGEGAGMPVWEYVAGAVFAPEGMAGARLASGASPAHGAEGTMADLLALGGELLAPHVGAPETLATATTVAFPGPGGVLAGFGRQHPNDRGLGFELRDAKHPHWTGSGNSPATFGHLGRSGSFLCVDPDARVACGARSDRAFGPWAADAWPALSDAVLRTVGALAEGSERG